MITLGGDVRSGNNGVTAFVVVSLTKSTEDVGLGCVKNILVKNVSMFNE